jgi:hypothetical protein
MTVSLEMDAKLDRVAAPVGTDAYQSLSGIVSGAVLHIHCIHPRLSGSGPLAP